MAGAINAVEAITWSACFYVFRCLLAEDVPATAGLMRPIEVIAPWGSVVNARPPAAVAGGNVETSQRIVDVLLRALAQAIPERIPAAEAKAMALVDYVAPPGKALAEARALAKKVLALPRNSVRMTKESVNAYASIGAHASSHMAHDQVQLAAASAEARAAREAFTRRRRGTAPGSRAPSRG